MVEIRKPISVIEAIRRVMAYTPMLGVETVNLGESMGRILAEPLIAKQDVPPFHRSPYDGFAIRSIDSMHAADDHPILFHVVEQIGAGEVASQALSKGDAVRIMTGAPLPQGADAIVMLEHVRITGDRFTIQRPYQALENVLLQGKDARAGEVLVEQGNRIHPGTVALLATFGYAQVQVAKRPVVGIVATGSELLEVHEALSPGKIRNSNGPMVAAQCAKLGIQARSYGIVKDDLESCLRVMRQALAETNCLITTGGVSVGDFDYLPEIYERLGAKVLFNKVAMRPGSVTTVALLDGQYMFGLSGNPSACYIGFEIFVRPALLRMMGNCRPYLAYTQAKLMEDYPDANPFTRFIRAIYRFDRDQAQAVVTSAGFNHSNAVSSIARGNALIVLPGRKQGFHKGEYVDVLLLSGDDGEEEWKVGDEIYETV